MGDGEGTAAAQAPEESLLNWANPLCVAGRAGWICLVSCFASIYLPVMKFSTKRKLAIIALTTAFGVAVLGNWRPGTSISSRTKESVSKMVLTAEPIYRQADRRWANEKVGGSGESLGGVGCTICCLCMALAEFDINLTPAELNEKLKAAGGYTEDGWVKWGMVEEVVSKRVRIEIPRWPMQSDINSALRDGCPVIVKVLLADTIPHWVLLVGREGNDYLMKDPNGDGKSLGVLASLHSDIKSVRIVRKA